MSAVVHVHPPRHQVLAIIQRALEEDVGSGDVTTDNAVPPEQRSRAVLLAKQAGVLCGGQVFAETLTLVDRDIKVDVLMADEDGLYDPGEFNDRLLLGLYVRYHLERSGR